MARFAVACALVAAAFCVQNASADDLDTLVKMGTKAIGGLCWYEFLNPLPDGKQKAKKFGGCYLNTDVGNLRSQFEGPPNNLKDPDLTQYVGEYMGKSIDEQLPEKYSGCESLTEMSNKDAAPSKDYGATLGDSGSSYPFRAFVHCLIGKAEATYGQEAIQALSRRWKGSATWQQLLLERENANRDRHGSKPLKSNKELNDRAQRWADKLVTKCGTLTISDHISKDSPDYLYKGEGTGESIGSSSNQFIAEDNALTSGNGWYDEIRSYPWPAYTGDGSDAQFLQIGHFTAQVWAGSREVGYGIGKTPGCKTTYIVARYWPAGNVVGQANSFAKNVLPPH